MDLGTLIAWVAEADEPRGRAVALALSSRGASVLVTGTSERAIAECVGEIAHAGGKARHFVGSATTAEGAQACIAAAVARFGALHLAVLHGAEVGATPAWADQHAMLRLVTLEPSSDETSAVAAVLATLASHDTN